VYLLYITHPTKARPRLAVGVEGVERRRGDELHELTLYCCYCGKSKDIKLPTTGTLYHVEFWNIVLGARWIIELNGDNTDVYCSRGCAKGETQI
jgi:hypothetical protein